MATNESQGSEVARVVGQSRDGTILSVWAVPGASRTEIVGVHGDRLRIRVAAPADGGRANRALVRVLAELAGTDVELLRGHRGRHKTFLIREMSAVEFVDRISGQIA